LDLLNMGAYTEAEPLLREVADHTQAQRNAATFMWQRRVVESLVGQGKFAEAEPIAQRALKGFDDKYGADDEDTLDCKYLLAVILNGQKKHTTALPLARRAFEGMEENSKRGPDHHTTLSCKALCAVLLQAQGQMSEARALAQSVLETMHAAEEKAEILASQGSRRLSEVELLGMKIAKSRLATVIPSRGNFKDAKQHPSIDTVSTDVPEPDAE
jgi:tetratricopeptide (TPR) repeat protein